VPGEDVEQLRGRERVASRELPQLPVDGEKQVKGLLTYIDCAGKEMTLTLNAGGREMKFWAPTGDKILFVSFVPDLKVICGSQKTPGLVRVTYRPVSAGQGAERGEGEPVAVEYVKP